MAGKFWVVLRRWRLDGSGLKAHEPGVWVGWFATEPQAEQAAARLGHDAGTHGTEAGVEAERGDG